VLLNYNHQVDGVKTSRRERSEATRRKIISAAEVEFLTAGYHGATIAAIAKRAGVAAQTVYFVFHNKAELISAVIENAVLGPDDPTPPHETTWWAAMVDERRPAKALEIFVRGAAPIFERTSGIVMVLHAAALTDEELRGTDARHEQMRYDAFRQVVETLVSKGRLKDGLDIRSATDVLMTIYGEEVCHYMTTSRGWTHDRYIDWVCEVLPPMLFGRSPAR
jgi:AcrR family transcriptional regulator